MKTTRKTYWLIAGLVVAGYLVFSTALNPFSGYWLMAKEETTLNILPVLGEQAGKLTVKIYSAR